MNEEWRIIPSAPDYEVSNLGRVRGRAGRQIWAGPRVGFRTAPEKLLRPGIASHGYPTVVLGRANTRTVHSLVAEAFLGPCPEGQEIRHGDDDRTNPKLENLSYGTRAQNVDDMHKRNRQVNNPEKMLATKDIRYPGWRAAPFSFFRKEVLNVSLR